VITNDARCRGESKFRIAMAKATINKERTLFAIKLDLKFKQETSEVLRLEQSFVRC
jgi:hypothetical protein